jgi:NAD(P)-dependent dehydrogenase (short-subunit alcohol dehydrogenase family)
MTMKFQGKTAIVTGGANGIGAAICRRYATEGARVGDGELVFTSMPTVTLLRDALIERTSVSKGSRRQGLSGMTAI